MRRRQLEPGVVADALQVRRRQLEPGGVADKSSTAATAGINAPSLQVSVSGCVSPSSGIVSGGGVVRPEAAVLKAHKMVPQMHACTLFSC